MVFLPHGLIVFSAVVLCALTSSCKKAEPRKYVVLEASAPERSGNHPLSATLIFEVIQVNSDLFESWIAENTLIPGNAAPLRKAAQLWIHEGDAALAETLTLSVKNGGSSQIQSEQVILSPKGDGEFLTNKTGISLEASVLIDPGSRECSVQLNPTVLSPDEGNAKPSNESRSNWSGAKLTTTISLAEMTYGFLGSCRVDQPLTNRKKQQKRTSLFFLRTDTNLLPESAPKLTSQL